MCLLSMYGHWFRLIVIALCVCLKFIMAFVCSVACGPGASRIIGCGLMWWFIGVLAGGVFVVVICSSFCLVYDVVLVSCCSPSRICCVLYRMSVSSCCM